MNHNEEVPDFLGGLGDMLPADVLKKVNELLERVHRADKDHQGSPVFIYAPGSQYVDKQFNIGAYPRPNSRLIRAGSCLPPKRWSGLWRRPLKTDTGGETSRGAWSIASIR